MGSQNGLKKWLRRAKDVRKHYGEPKWLKEMATKSCVETRGNSFMRKVQKMILFWEIYDIRK